VPFEVELHRLIRAVIDYIPDDPAESGHSTVQWQALASLLAEGVGWGVGIQTNAQETLDPHEGSDEDGTRDAALGEDHPMGLKRFAVGGLCRGVECGPGRRKGVLDHLGWNLEGHGERAVKLIGASQVALLDCGQPPQALGDVCVAHAPHQLHARQAQFLASARDQVG
jgi:hypothetical protein